jgi:hypothetical protein
MNYRRPALPWIVAAVFLAGAMLFAALAQQGLGPGAGIGWAIASFIQAIFGFAIVVLKLRHGTGPQ